MSLPTTRVASFLELEDLHVFVTGYLGGIGTDIVKEFLELGCKVSAADVREIASIKAAPDFVSNPRFHALLADISCEESISSALKAAVAEFGPLNILIANAGISDELNAIPIWDLSVAHWDKINHVNYRGTFLTVKHFLARARDQQEKSGKEVDNLAIVIIGSECGKFGQEGHVDYAAGKAGLQYGLVSTVKNEIVRLNSRARINAVAPGWVDTPLIAGRLDDPTEAWAEAESTVALRKIALPSDVARTTAFLASHRAAGHISGQVISVDGGMEGRMLWKQPRTLRFD